MRLSQICETRTGPIEVFWQYEPHPRELFPRELDIRVLVDRGSVEVFAGMGQTAVSVASIPDEKNRKVVPPTEGDFTIRIASLYRVRSAWEK